MRGEMGKIVAVTGVNSYFASTILQKLEADSSIDKILGIDVTPWKGGYSKVEFHKEDVRSKKLTDIFRGVDVVFHFAFVVGEIKDKQKIHDININGSRNVFAACVHNNVQKIIYASSITVYGSYEDTPLGLTEEYPLNPNPDSYYNSSKVEVENFVVEYFKDYPNIVLTVMRAGLLCGPKINNMFSKLWSMKIGSLPMGSKAYLQLIHEEDLGDAMYLAYVKNIPGVYNVAADDAVSSRWCFKKAGVFMIPLPMLLLKPIADLSFKLKLFPAGGGWAKLSQHTIFTICDKFKKATGWRPRYTSVETYEHYLKSRVRDAKDNLIQSILSWVFKSGIRIRPTMAVLHIFKLGKIKSFRNKHPWMNPEKNSMTYLPISYRPPQKTINIQINETAGNPVSEILPPQIVHDFIEKANFLVIMDHCGCRLAGQCKHFTADVGCLFMGETALKLPHGVSRRVSREKAHRHVDRAIGVGLVPIVGKIRVDNFIFLTPDTQKLLSVCFCCHCCCMMGAFKHIPAEHLDQVMTPLEGARVEVSDACIGCGTCIETCIFEAIHIAGGRAVHNRQCRACGRCVTYCPHHAVTISIDNIQTFKNEVEQRIEAYLKIA
jgi:UDP-glucose 4-epimerase